MIKIENVEVVGWEHAIRGMRNPMNSWDRSDSRWSGRFEYFSGKPEWEVGSNDMTLMKKLAKAGTEHRKYLRMIVVYLDITAPLYWWKEFDTYKVGTVANSCSTMHKIAAKEFTRDDFSFEYASTGYPEVNFEDPISQDAVTIDPTDIVDIIVDMLNAYRREYNLCVEKQDRKDLSISEKMHVIRQKRRYWYNMIQLLPTSYNQKRTIMLNYEVLANIYRQRKGHKLDEWNVLCSWIETLPYSELITGKIDEGEIDNFVKNAKKIDSRIDRIDKVRKSPSVYILVDDEDYVLYSFDFSRTSFGEAISFIQKWVDKKNPETKE